MRHVTTIASTALTANLSSWGATMMVAHLAENRGSVRRTSQVRSEPSGMVNTAHPQDMPSRCPRPAGRRLPIASQNRFLA